jgi:uncharacterized membrane protein YgdD (TMEM256/DUF423 family)
MRNFFTIASGLSGALGVGAGALGAHAMLKKPETYRDVWKTANLYHMLHTCALAIVAFAPLSTRKRNICGSLFLTGILLFSGSCYTVAIMEERKPYSYPAPVGGMCLIAGWVALAVL